MKTNPVGIELIKQHTSLRLEAAKDSSGRLVIGYDHYEDVVEGQQITTARATELLFEDLARTEEALSRFVTRPLNSNQFSALVSLFFNSEIGRLRESKLLRDLNAGAFVDAADEFLSFCFRDGKEIPVLSVRRKAERELFLRPETSPVTWRLFAPPEQFQDPFNLETPRERELVAWIARKLGMRWREVPESGKVFLGAPNPAVTVSATNTTTSAVAAARPITLKPLAQKNSVSCGQTSVAMCINFLTGSRLDDRDIDARYGFSLLRALQEECDDFGFRWVDAGNLSRDKWPDIEKRVNLDGIPVVIGLNGEFSASGRGHIVTIFKVDNDVVHYADPADGRLKTTKKKNMEDCRPHPDGKFIFCGSRVN